MATKPRHLKTAMQLWIMDNRKRLGLTSLDLADLTGVDEDTARAWESRGRPSQDAIDLLVKRFGVPAPANEGQATGQEALVAALAEQTAALNALTAAISQERAERREFELGLIGGLRDLAQAAQRLGPPNGRARTKREGAAQ